jgi:hypothetical protein
MKVPFDLRSLEHSPSLSPARLLSLYGASFRSVYSLLLSSCIPSPLEVFFTFMGKERLARLSATVSTRVAIAGARCLFEYYLQYCFFSGGLFT